MHINLIINSPQVILKNSQLAFNVNIIYISKSINKYKVIKKIELEKFNKIFLKKFLLKNTSLFKISNVNTTNILKNIERLKSYGFLTKVKLSFVKAHNIKYVTLNFKINPILKRIKISKQKTLLIPHYLLIDTFKKQIGLPKNYIDINKSINTINLWYKSRGFDWVNIELIKTKRLEEIHLKIFEGQIAKSNLVCTQENILSQNLMHDIEYTIKQKLGIIPGYILNIKQLELGIIQLKQKKLIDNCKYIINQNSHGLNIFFKYDLFKNNQAFFYKHQTIIDYYKQILKIFKYSMYRTKTISRYHIKRKYAYYNRKLTPLNYIIKSIIGKVKNQISINIESLFKYFGFKYYSYPTNESQQSFIVDMQIIGENTQTKILFSYPSIKIYDYFLDYFILNAYYQYCKHHTLDPLKSMHILTLYNTDINPIYTKIKSFGADILLRNYLYQYIYVTEQIINQYNTSNQRLINFNNYYQYNLFQNQDPKFILIASKNINKIIKQNLIFLKMQIKYNTLYLTQQLKSGILFIAEAIYYIPLFITQNHLLNAKKFSSPSLHIKYHQVFVLPQIIKYTYNNVLIFLAEIDCCIGKQHYKPTFQTNYKSDKNIYFQNYQINKTLFKPSFLYHIEYNIFLFNYLSLYIFCNFAHDLYNKIRFLNFAKYHILNSSSYYEIIIGSGIQFNIPVKQIPKLRIEYSISNKTNNFLQLRAYSQYND